MLNRSSRLCIMPLVFLVGAPHLLQAGEARPFDAAWLRAEAKRVASKPYTAPPENLPDWMIDLDYDAYQSIKYRKDKALWRGRGGQLEARLFHLGLFFRKPVGFSDVYDGKAHPLHYS